MRITVCLTQTRPEPWIEGLRAALPDAEIQVWTPGVSQADHAVVWAPPQAFIDEQPGLGGLFNIGAGVDALLQLKLPPQTVRASGNAALPTTCIWPAENEARP